MCATGRRDLRLEENGGTSLAYYRPCTPPGGFCTQQACGKPLAREGEDCKSFGNPTLPECEAGLICQPGPTPDTAHCRKPTCQQTGCPTGKQCVPCKTLSGWDFFCIPNGAMC